MIEADASKKDNIKKRVIFYGRYLLNSFQRWKGAKQVVRAQNGSCGRGRGMCKGIEMPENRGHVWNGRSKSTRRQRS